MNKIFLIIQREYRTRVRKRVFIVLTILSPLAFAVAMIFPLWLSAQKVEEKEILLLDHSGYFNSPLAAVERLRVEPFAGSLEEAKDVFITQEKYGLLYIPALNTDQPEGIRFFSVGSPSMETIQNIRELLTGRIKEIKLKNLGIKKETLEMLNVSPAIQTIDLTGTEEKTSDAALSSAIGYGSAILIYMFIFLYGAQVMRGVIEEKSNRIVEVIISSVRPFQLMMGKIIGVACVGLTQFVIWIILTGIFYFVFAHFFGMENIAAASEGAVMVQTPDVEIGALTGLGDRLLDAHIIQQLLFFLFYFLGGYLLYGALFAAIGSAVDKDSDYQQFMLPISIPLLIAVLSLTAVVREPDGELATWLSLIPFTSPVVMLARLPFSTPPLWEIALSMVLLVLGFLFTTWLAGRIYRIGILIHGTKVSYRTIGKWLLTRS